MPAPGVRQRTPAPNAPGRDPIVTRILWLKGMEDRNRNTFRRTIYIHGTPEERRLGEPVSYGCIRMASRDVMAAARSGPLSRPSRPSTTGPAGSVAAKAAALASFALVVSAGHLPRDPFDPAAALAAFEAALRDDAPRAA